MSEGQQQNGGGSGPRELAPLEVVIRIVAEVLGLTLAAVTERVERVIVQTCQSLQTTRDQVIEQLGLLDPAILGMLFSSTAAEQQRILVRMIRQPPAPVVPDDPPAETPPAEPLTPVP